MRVYPNPASVFVNLVFETENDSDASATLLRSDGKLVRNFDFGSLSAGSHTLRADLGYVPSGVYLMQVKTGEMVVTHHLVVTP